MVDKKLLEWYEEQLNRGLTRDELVQILYELGYPEDEISDLLSAVESAGKSTVETAPTPKEVPPTEEKPPEIIETPVGRAPKKVKAKHTPEGPSKSLWVSRAPKKTKAEPTKKKEEAKSIGPSKPIETSQVEKPIKIPKTMRKHAVIRSQTLSEVISEEFGFLWKLILIASLLVIIVIGVGLYILFASTSTDGGFPFIVPQKVDKIPPKVEISVPQTEWVSTESVSIKCSDSGIDFSSGCDNTTYAFYLSTKPSCPSEYSLYQQSIPSSYRSGYLCIAAKDKEGNMGFSKPVAVKFDLIPPKTTIQQSSSWFKENFLVNFTDEDNDSGLSICFYRVLSSRKTVLDWTSRACNSSAEVPVGLSGCDTDGRACTVEAYALDNAGNKGNVVSSTFNIDLTPPFVSITEVTPSTVKDGSIVVSGPIQIKGTVSDTNFKDYTLEIRSDTKSELIVKSNKEINNNVLGSYDTRKLKDGSYKLVLTAVDLAGNIKSIELEINVNKKAVSCNPGETESCSWLPGVCSSSQRTCGSAGTWGDCNVQILPNYEPIETLCNDSLDNDCDGLVDCVSGQEDPDCNCNISEFSCSANRLVGDVNGDGKIDLYDATVAGKIANGTWGFSGDDCCVDVNGDGQITEDDSTAIADFVLGKTNCFTTGYSCSLKENCSDGIDNDCDGLIDCDGAGDPDCDCTPSSSVSCVGGSQRVGDVNNDGEIDSKDLDIISGILNGSISFVGSNVCCVDVDGNGLIENADAVGIAQYYFGSTDCFDRGYSCNAKENCSDHIDNDCDGLTDCKDPDCNCTVDEYHCIDDLPAPPRMIGDVDGDGSITTQDAQIILAVSTGEAVITDDICCADVDADGDVDADDASLVLGFEPGGCFPAGYSCQVKELCIDGIDNDCDNFTDTVDSDCCPNYGCADLNGNGLVGETDVALIQDKLGQSYTRYDINNDGIVDDTDLNFVTSKMDDSTTCSQLSKCPDFNNDGTVNVLDATLLGQHYPSCSLYGPYDSKYDLNDNGVIDNGDWIAFNNVYNQDRCSITQCVEQSETNCSDGIDNDCDGLIDCQQGNEDPDCNCGTLATTCLTANTNQITHDTSNNDYILNTNTADMSPGNLAGVQITRGYVRWDTSSIPDTATITKLTFQYHCSRQSGVWGLIKEMSYDPAQYSSQSRDLSALFNDCGDGLTYGGGTNIFPIEGTDQQIVLDDNAASQLQSQLGADWFALGFISSNESEADHGYIIEGGSGATPKPTLCIEYRS